MVQTNQINIEFNYQNITNDFFIFKFETTEKSYKYSFIDDVKQLLKTVAVVYLQGKNFYALFSKKDFPKKQDIYTDLDKIIGNNKDIKWKDIENLKFEINSFEKESMDKRQLTQLLLNSLSGINQYNNITGKLYYVIDSNSKKQKTGENIIWKYTTLEFTINYYDFPKKLCLSNSVKTFTNVLLSKQIEFTDRKLKEYPFYEINPATRKMIRVPFDRKSKNIYINRTIKGEKNEIDFLDFSNWSKFKNSKCGIFYKFQNDLKKNLSQYFTKFEFVKIANNEKDLKFSKDITQNKDEKIREFYKTTPIIINIDTLEEKNDIIKAKQLADKIIVLLTDKDKVYKIPEKNISIGKITDNSINIRIIHNKKYYENNKDPKRDFVGQKQLIQHITLEDFADYKENEDGIFDFVIPLSNRGKGLNSPALDNLFKELYIKKDILNKTTTLVDWKLEKWKFIIREQLEIDKNNKKDIFHSLKIDRKGKLYFNTYKNELKKEFRELKPIFEKYGKNYNQEIEGIVISENEDINVIIRTELHTLPDFEKIGNDLKNRATENSYQTKYIIELFKQFYEELPNDYKIKYKDKYNELINSLEKYKKEITKEEINTKLSDAKFTGGTKFRKMFTWYFEEMTGDVLATFFKDGSIRDDLFSSNIGIWYRQWINEKGKVAMYYIGKKTGGALQQKIDKATILRKVVAYKGDLVFEKLLQTMNVDFVRNGALTVIPYPFKYLREMIEL